MTIDCAFLGTFEKFIGMDMSFPPLYLHPYFLGIVSPSLNAGELISIAKALMGSKDMTINDKNFNIMKLFFYYSCMNLNIYKSNLNFFH